MGEAIDELIHIRDIEVMFTGDISDQFEGQKAKAIDLTEVPGLQSKIDKVNNKLKVSDFKFKTGYDIELKGTGGTKPWRVYLTDYGKSYVTTICQLLSSSHARYRIADALYTGLTDNYDFHAPLDAYNSRLNNLFSYPYQLIAYNNELLRRASQSNIYALMPMSVLTNSLAYYELVVMFGGVPYINENQDMYDYNIPRSSQEEILSKLVKNMTSIIDNLQDTKAGYITTEDDLAMPSKDLARMVLADIYMYQGNYGAAKTLLAEIVNGGKYSLVAEQNGMGENEDFFPGVVTMGDILKKEGYRNRLLMGSDSSFGGCRK